MSAAVRTFIAAVLVVTAVAMFHTTSVETQGNPTINQRLAVLEEQVAILRGEVTALQAANAALQADITAEAAARATADTGLQTQINNIATVPQNVLDLANYVSTDLNTINGLAGPHVIFSGANVHVQNGLGATNGNPADPAGAGILNGLGNFVVGYNEALSGGIPPRSGSHNVIVGTGHRYASYGGLVAGSTNDIGAPYASVTGGFSNRATGLFASVSGGNSNSAGGRGSTISGGQRRRF